MQILDVPRAMKLPFYFMYAGANLSRFNEKPELSLEKR